MSGPIQDVTGLKNLWARGADGRLIHPSRCATGIDYLCPLPACGQRIRVRAADSTHQRPHLYHCDGGAHEGESWEHNMSKQIVAQRLRDWLAGVEPPPFIGRMCPKHEIVFDTFGGLEGASGVEIEAAMGTRRADVLLLRAGLPSVAFELCFSHAVDDEKAAELAAIDVTWLELDATQVLAGKPWVYLRGTAASVPCRLCLYDTAIARRRQEEVEAQQRASEAAVQAARCAAEKRDLEQQMLNAAHASQRQMNEIESRIALAQLRASKVEEDSQRRIDVAVAALSVAHLEPLCRFCGLPLPEGQSDSSHRIVFSQFHPHERDAFRAAHPNWRAA
ncbi:MAG: hypothetical protein WKG00_03195 [Polyangiaceae bacterium]